MYTIELTRGMGWDAPVVEVHTVKQTIHIVDVERRAQTLLNMMRPSFTPPATPARGPRGT